MALVKIGMFKVFIKTAYRYSHDRTLYGVLPYFIYKNMSILNIGSGATGAYAKLFENTKYETLDIDRSTHPTYCLNILKSIPNKKYDLIVSFNVLEHIAEPKIYLKNVKKLLKPDGCFIGTVPFMYAIHSDQDYYRYTEAGLAHILKNDFRFYILPFGNPVITMLRSLASIKYIGIFFNLTSRFWEFLFKYTDPKSPSGYLIILEKKT